MKKIKEENNYLKKEMELLKKDLGEIKNRDLIYHGRNRSGLSNAEQLEITPDIGHRILRQKPDQLRTSEDFPALPPRKRTLNTKVTHQNNPVPPPRKSRAKHKVNRINEQITALKTARTQILSSSREKKQKETKQEISLVRTGPRIIHDVTILPSRKPSPVSRVSGTEENWTRVEANRKKNRNKMENTNRDRKLSNTDRQMKRPTQIPPRKRPPRSSAVSIKVQEGTSYDEALRKVRREMSLSDLGIDNIRIRRAANRSTLIEISGLDNANKADALAEKVQKIFGNQAKITRPKKRADIRIINFDESVTIEKIECAISEIGSCKIADVKVGRISLLQNGTCVAIANCPLGAAIEITNQSKI